MNEMSFNSTPAPPRVAVTYMPSGPADVDTRIAYAWLTPGEAGDGEIALQARCIELEDQIRAVCLAQSASSRAERAVLRLWAGLWVRLGSPPEEDETGTARVARTTQHLLRRLSEAAQECLAQEPPQAELFEARAAAIKAEALRRMGMARKSARVSGFAWTLLRWIATMALLLWGFDEARGAGLVPAKLAVPPENLALLWAGLLGAGLGAWISYAQRSMNDDFASLQALASDTVSPRVRAAFVFACSLVGLLLFEVQLVTLKIGNLDTTRILDEFAAPLLVGIFFGLAERALPEALTRRAQDFVGRMSAAAAAANGPAGRQ